ncbi:MAG TPA: LysR family transcriptional regulator [Anaeromyxobacteraceae bacterium]|nr:LysR family transcriptional regulator [Anaeromyxobacteraceae bacterium]
MLDLNDMAVFARVVREQSFTRAARALGLPKSSVSHRVARLEARLGARLLHRTTRSVRCTDAGDAYYQRCTRIVTAAEEADEAASERQGALRGRVRLCAPNLFGTVLLPAVLAEFLRAHPETQVEVMLRDGPVDLVREGIDLAVRVGRVRGDGLVSRRLGVAHHVVCASPRYARERGLPRTPGDLQEHECILYDGLPVVPAAWPFARGGQVVRVRVRGRLTVGSVQLAQRAALDGLGIATLPAFVCAADLRAGRLVPVLEGWTGLATPIHVVYPTRRHVPGRVRRFIDLMVERFGKQPPWAVEPDRARA